MNTWMTPRCGFEPLWCQISATMLVPLNKAFYSNCSVVWRSCKAVGPMYMYLNSNTSVYVKERHGLFEKSRGSSRYCSLYFKTTFIYSRTGGKVQLVCTQCVNTQTYEFSTNKGRRSFLTIKFALHIWCFMSPPPKMIMPVWAARTAILLMSLMSENLNKQHLCFTDPLEPRNIVHTLT